MPLAAAGGVGAGGDYKWVCVPADAQVGVFTPQPRFELSETVQLDRADGVALAQLERVKACLADRQWGDAIDALQKLAETADGKLMPVTEHRCMSPWATIANCNWRRCPPRR